MPDEELESSEELEEIIEDYLIRLELGDEVDEARILAAHPRWVEDLASFFELHRRACRAFASDEVRPVDPAAATLHYDDPTLDQTRDLAAASDSAWSWNRVAAAQFPLPFGPYDLLREVNRGGMGIVYQALHRELHRVVALKLMRAGDLASEEEIQRFRTEAIASSALQHPNIIPIFETGAVHSLVYFTMPFIEGDDLSTLLRNGPLAPERAAMILLKVTDAVAYAHRKNVIHRDIKPSNIMVNQEGEPCLLDFGLAHLCLTDDRLTVTGQVLGTPAYMAPEQATGRLGPQTPAVDIYALGAVLYAALTGRAPFSGATAIDVLLQLLDREPPAPSQLNRRVPRVLQSICLKAMDKDPQHRYSTAEAMADDLRHFLRGEPVAIPQPSLGQRLETWWRRSPVLVSHLVALAAVAMIVLASFLVRYPTVPISRFSLHFGLLMLWTFVSLLLQRLSRADHRVRDYVYLTWAAADVIIYTFLIYVADAPRGLLLVGYPMMIAASGLFYQARFVVFTTALCCGGLVLLASVVDDPLAERLDFVGIYLSGLLVLSLCVLTMIRRVRGLSQFCGESESPT